MRKRPQEEFSPAMQMKHGQIKRAATGLVLSGGGARAAYQIGALKALAEYLDGPKTACPISVIIGSSIGAINGLLVASSLKRGIGPSLERLEAMWRRRDFRNTFRGSPSQAFFRAVKIAVLQYMSPGPNATSDSIFDPTPLMNEVDSVIAAHGGLDISNWSEDLQAVGVMTTVEGAERKPMLFCTTRNPTDPQVLQGASFSMQQVKTLTAKYGFASAALPSVLPPVELDVDGGTIKLVDGGISQNIPVDPAVRLGAERVIVIDVSGRDWWLDKYKEEHDTRPTWEVPAAIQTFCLRPPETFVARVRRPLGPLLKESVSKSRRQFMAALGPVWPVFTLLQKKLGEEIAYEAMSYVALDPDYLNGVLERGYLETQQSIREKGEHLFSRSNSYKEWMEEI